MTDDKITLFLMDDHQIVVEGIIALVSQDPCIQVVGHCNDGLELMDKLHQARPDVLVLDISIPGLNGLDACRMVSTELPRTKVLMLTMHSNEQCVLDAFERGASGYLIKETVSQEFCEAVHAVARGELYLCRSLPRGILNRLNRKEPDPYDTLTDRERKVLQLVAEGRPNAEVGALVGVSASTIDSDYASLTGKLGIQNPIDLVKYAIRKHIIVVT
jgi:DNA-binding NarL/FixJ family response regulator